MILTFSVNHAQKFKGLAKRVLYVMVNCWHLNPNAEGFILDEGLF
jgi:hypothetical protein